MKNNPSGGARVMAAPSKAPQPLKTVRLILKSNTSAPQKAAGLFRLLYRRTKGIFKYLVLIALSVVFIAPFFYMVGHSFMGTADVLNPSIQWLPRSLNWANYRYAYNALNYTKYLLRTLVIVGLCVFGQVMSCSFVAYGIARIKFRLSGLIFGIILFIMIVPPQTIIMPSYIMFSNAFNWYDSFLPIVVPCFFAMGLNGGLIIFVFRQFFRNLPNELENAALIDGAGVFQAYFRVVFPNVVPAILITSILSLVWQWDNSFEPSIYIKDISKGTLAMQLNVLQGRLSETAGGVDFNQGIKMAATILVLLPIIVIFFLLQRRFMKSVASTGLAN